MDKEVPKKQNQDDFQSEYDKIVNTGDKSVYIDTQWSRSGDYFKKFSTYDDSYVAVPSLGSTTLIK